MLGEIVLHKWESETRREREMIGNGMTSEGQIFSQQEMNVAIKKMKENKAADESGVIAEYMKALEVEKTKRHNEWNI